MEFKKMVMITLYAKQKKRPIQYTNAYIWNLKRW